MINPFFSLIIPNYNTPTEYLKNCLDSVVNQDYTNFEIICINDGSTDDSLNVLNEYREKYSVVKIISQENKGISSARNRGIKEAKGDYLLFVDNDDYLLRHSVLTELAQILRTENYDCIYFPGANAGTNPNGSTWFCEDKFEEKIYDSGYKCLEDYCLTPKIIVFGSVYVQCYKTDILRKNNLFFDEKIKFGADDRLFVLQYFYLCKKTFVYPNAIYCWVTRKSSLSNSTNPLNVDLIKESFYYVEKLYNLVFSQANIKKKNISKYLNGLYREAIAKSYKANLKSHYNKKILFKTAFANYKILIKSVILAISPKLYLKFFKINL